MNSRASLTSRVPAVPSSDLPARPSAWLARTGTPVPSTSIYSMSGSGPGGGIGTIRRSRIADASAAVAARAAAPLASADRSIVRGLIVRPARPDRSRPARAKETSAPASAFISARPGDCVAPATPSC